MCPNFRVVADEVEYPVDEWKRIPSTGKSVLLIIADRSITREGDDAGRAYEVHEASNKLHFLYHL